jgi:hypothetical protein
VFPQSSGTWDHEHRVLRIRLDLLRSNQHFSVKHG